MGAWDGFYSLGGTEIANEERYRSYINNVAPWLPVPDRSLVGYEGLHKALGDPAYVNPTEDRAPWVDLDDPVTADFLGFTVLSVEGLEDSTRSSSSIEALSKGGTVSMSRESSRSIRITGLLVGLSEEAVQQGFTWLRNVLWGTGNDRPLVPQLPGVSDFRFFAQRPEYPEAVVNRVLNPTGDGLGESIAGFNGTAYAFRQMVNGDWAYKITSRVLGDAEAILIPAQRPTVAPGQRWAARARVWTPTAGERYIKVLLRFRDQYGQIIKRVGLTDTTVPTGVMYRWVGVRYDSVSQMLTPDGMLTNFMLNPSAEGKALGLQAFSGNAAKVSLVANSTLSGKRSYRMLAGTTGTATIRTVAAPAEAGQQWWGRARARFADAAGARHVRADLAFYRANGQETGRVLGTQVDLVPSGVFRRWTGAAGNSVSEEFSGETKRVNYVPNSTFLSAAGAAGYAGVNATISREKSNILGTTYLLRVNPANTKSTVTGVSIPCNVPKGTEVYVTFMIASTGGSIPMKLNGTGWEAASGNANDLAFTVTATPSRVTIRLRMTAAPSGQTIRIARTQASYMNAFRISQVGILTGNGTFFNGDAGGNTGPQFRSDGFDFVVGGVAPDDTTSVRVLFSSIGGAATAATDTLMLDQVMVAQVDVGDGVTPTVPSYFDGDSLSTYEAIASDIYDATTSDTHDALVTGVAPDGAVTVELAVQRAGQGGAPVVGDVVYADNLFLAEYAEGDPVPDFTSLTLHDVVAEADRKMQDVFPLAGPTVIQSIDLDCQGAAMQVEFTLDAENPTWLRDQGDVVPLPLPSNVVQGNLGNGSFAKIEDRAGIVKNFMPQFSISSPLIPSSWVTKATNGSIEVGSYQANSAAPYALSVRVGPAGTNWTTVVSALSVLGAMGGFDSATASIWVGGNVSRSTTIKFETLNGSTVVNTATKTITTVAVGLGGSVFTDACRVDFPTSTNGAQVDGFRFTVTGSTDSVTTYIGNPQVTLGSDTFPMINGTLPDDGSYTYDFDAAGFSRRTPVKNVRSHTIFANLTAPPNAPTSLGGYDEVGLTTYRTYAAIPAEIVPRNSDAVPVFRVDFDAFITRWVRVRFYPNPTNASPELIDTSSFTHEWVVDLAFGHIKDYPTAGAGYTSVVIDGVARRVWLRTWDGTVIPGDQFVLTSEGSPIDWPTISGVPYVVSVEYPTFKQYLEPAGEGWWRASLALMIEE